MACPSEGTKDYEGCSRVLRTDLKSGVDNDEVSSEFFRSVFIDVAGLCRMHIVIRLVQANLKKWHRQ